MRAIQLTLIALASLVGIGAAFADEAKAPEIVVVTAQRPVAVETPEVVTVEAEKLAPAVDFTDLVLEAPSLDASSRESRPARAELASADTGRSKS